MNVGSLFAGIGGFDLGLERAGMRTVWQVEQSEFRRRVLARHFPDAQRFEDVRAVGAAELERVDVICGGFPCQDLSLAGKGAGIDGTRSGLWSEYARIVGELRPRYVIVENVPALLARGMGRVLGDLAALGYDAEWDCIPASAIGAPHRRDRIWIVAYPNGSRRAEQRGQREEVGRSEQPLLNGEGRTMADTPRDAQARQTATAGSERERTGAGGESARSAPDPDCERQAGRGLSEGQGGQAVPDARRSGETDERGAVRPSEWWLSEPDVGRVANGVPDRVDRLAALGDALVPQIAEWIGRRLMEAA